MKTFVSYSLFFLLNKFNFIVLPLALVWFVLLGCENSVETISKSSSLYLNHSDTAKYVGINTCKLCHASVYESYIQTGMGRSMGWATQKRSAADFSNASVYDAFKNLHYQASWQQDSLFISEYRLKGSDTLHALSKRVHYIVGSGQHTNSHLHVSGNYLTQMPMTFYTQKARWDLPPGFEAGVNTRFSRKIGLECMTCHNAYPDFVEGSENKYSSLPEGIDCERCHGPGSIHVAQRSSGSQVDTSIAIDYSIVNPSKLPIDLQFDICQRCHLQGNSVLKEGKSFYDFKPGQKLSEVMTVFLPKYRGAEDEFIMASHADRLKQSACFIRSLEKAKPSSELKPYKGALTCVTCHNPHVSVKTTRSEVFDKACINCHGSQDRLNETHTLVKEFRSENCFTCHMPVSGSTDIPHVTVHDHFIRKPVSQRSKKEIKTFLGLYAINEKNPEPLVRAKAYLNQFDKFEQNKNYLDSAHYWLNRCDEGSSKFQVQVQLSFTEAKPLEILQNLKKAGEKKVYQDWAKTKSYDNAWAWTCYRIGEAYVQTQQSDQSILWLNRAVDLAPYQLDFRNKLGNALAQNRQVEKAKEQFRWILAENPSYAAAYSNLGYLLLVEGQEAEAKKLFFSGLKQDPDNESLLLNLASLCLQSGDKAGAKSYLQRVVKLNNKNVQALRALSQLENVP